MTSDDPDAELAATFAAGRRLHPAAAVAGALRALRGVAVPLLVAVVAGGGGDMGRSVVLGLLGVGFSLASGIVGWRATSYALRGGALRFRRGVLSPDDVVVPVARIQALDTVQGPVQRLFGVVALHVQTPGGGANGEVVLDAVAPRDVRALRAALGHPEPVRDGPRRRLGLGALLLAAVTGPQFGVVLPVAGAAFAGAGDLFGNAVGSSLVERLDTPGEAARAAILVLGASLVVSVAATVVAFAGFEVEREGDRLRIRRGLFERRAATVVAGRVDGVAVVEGLLRRPFGLASLRLETAGLRAEQAAARTLFPLVRTRDVPELLAELVPGLDGSVPQLTRPPARGARRHVTTPALAGAAGGVAAALAVAALHGSVPGGLWLAPLVLAAAGALGGLPGARAAGLHLGPDRVVLRARRGTARVTLHARRRRLQATGVRRSPLQRRAGLATFEVALGSGRRGRVRHLEARDADAAQAALPE